VASLGNQSTVVKIARTSVSTGNAWRLVVRSVEKMGDGTEMNKYENGCLRCMHNAVL
jgi:hypothetical protein